jgi:hypothetical protein
MNKETFLDTLRSQYAEEIHEAHIECERGEGRIDLEAFAHKLHQLRKAAQVEGLPNQDFDDLVNATIPALMQGKALYKKAS